MDDDIEEITNKISNLQLNSNDSLIDDFSKLSINNGWDKSKSRQFKKIISKMYKQICIYLDDYDPNNNDIIIFTNKTVKDIIKINHDFIYKQKYNLAGKERIERLQNLYIKYLSFPFSKNKMIYLKYFLLELDDFLDDLEIPSDFIIFYNILLFLYFRVISHFLNHNRIRIILFSLILTNLILIMID